MSNDTFTINNGRQGDVILVRLTGKPKMKLKKSPVSDPRGVVLAEGETSGHYHAVVGGKAELFEYEQPGILERILNVVDTAVCKVIGAEAEDGTPRHKPFELKPGMYEQRVQRAWTSENAFRQTVD